MPEEGRLRMNRWTPMKFGTRILYYKFSSKRQLRFICERKRILLASSTRLDRFWRNSVIRDLQIMPLKKFAFRENQHWEGRAFLQSRNQPILSPRQEYQIPARLPSPYFHCNYFLEKVKYANNRKMNNNIYFSGG
jgi:hypothetical protein